MAVLLATASSTYRFGLTYSMIIMLLALSYVVITGYLGQISLAQAAFAGAAGFTLSKVTTDWNMPFLLALVFSSLVAAVPRYGGRLARVSDPRGSAGDRDHRRRTGHRTIHFQQLQLDPGVRESDRDPPSSAWISVCARVARSPGSVLLTVLVIAAIVVWAFIRIASGDTGRTFLAVRANERAAASVGINVRLTKIVGFGLSAFIAGVAGCLMGYSAGQLSAESFTVFVGLQVLAVAYLGGITSFSGAAIAGIIGPLGIVYVLVHNVFELGDYYALISGIALIVTAIMNPVGIAGEASRIYDRIRTMNRRPPDRDPDSRGTDRGEPPEGRPSDDSMAAPGIGH